MNAEVIDKATGATNQVALDTIDLNNASIVRLQVRRADMVGLERQGDDLIVRLASGEQLRIEDFYMQHAGTGSDLVLVEPDGNTWLAQAAPGGPRFSSINDLEDLMGVGAAGGGGSSLTIPAVLGGLALGGGALAAAGGGGGGGNNGGRDGGGGSADVTAPAAPTATVRADGAAVVGQGEPGATVQVRNGAGTLIGSGVVAADGTFGVPISPAQTNGEPLSVTQADAAGNVSAPATAAAPDLTAPPAPVVAITPDGTAVTGTGEPGAVVEVRDGAGTLLGSGTVPAGGAINIPLSPPQTNGGTLTVVQSDPAGNESPGTTITVPDTTAPLAPVVSIAPDGTSVTGTGEPGATVTVRDGAGTVVGSGPVDPNGGFTIPLDPTQVNGGTLTVVQADGGNNQSPPVLVAVPDTTVPLAPSATVSGDGTSVSGTGEPGARITVTNAAGAIVGTAVAAADGSYTAPLSVPQVSGGTLTVTQADPAGNVSPGTAALTPDLTAPAAPVVTLAPGGGSVSGTGEAGATVTVRDGSGTSIGSGTVASDGSFTVPLTPAQANGGAITVVQADPAGNASPTVTVPVPDSTAPTPPTAAVSADGTQVAGTGEAGATVTITAPDGTAIGTALVNADGSYTAVIVPPQTNGEQLGVGQTDAAGNPSGATTAIAPDLTAPAAPTALISADGTQVTGLGEANATIRIVDAAGVVVGTGTVADTGDYAVTLVPAQTDRQALTVVQVDGGGNVSPGISLTAPDLTAPDAPVVAIDATGSVITGTGEAGAMVTVRDSGGALLGTGTVNAQGAFSVVLTPAQVDSQALGVVQTDGNGNSSPAATLTAPDLTAPAAPTASVEQTAGATLTGTGEPNATISVTDPLGVVIGTGTVGADGTYSVVLDPAQTDGEALSVTQRDAAGNVSAPAIATAPDLVLDAEPPAPTAAVLGDGSAVEGFAGPLATVRAVSANGVTIGTVTAAADGSYSVPLTPPLLDGETVRVVQIDPDGDVSPPTTAIAPDLTAPGAPTAAIDATGAVVTGTGVAGSTITVADPTGAIIGTATVAPNGAYTAVLSPAQTNGEALAVRQSDAALNASAPAPLTAPDFTAPPAPQVAVNGSGTVVTGTGEAGATVTVRDPAGAVIGTATVAPDGSFNVPLTPAQANGQALTVTQADAAGNASPVVTAVAPDITPPGVPTAAVNATGTAVAGAGEPGATVTVTDAAGNVLGTAVVGTSGSYAVTLTPAQANGGTLSVVQTDAAGNPSGPATAAAPDITAPVAPTASIAASGTAVTGTGEAGATITVRDGAGAAIGTATVAADSTYSATLTPAQTNGQALTVIQFDAGGNASPPVPLTAPDLTAPAAPTAAVAADGSFVTGTGEPGATVTITNATGTVLGTAPVAADGSYTAVLTPAQVNGEALVARQADAAGNASGTAGVTAPDLTAPAAPAAAINANGSAITGTGEPGATVTVTSTGGAILGTATVAANGSYSVSLTPAQTRGQTLNVRQEDRAGNDSPVTPVTAPDFVTPAAPTAAINADGSVVTGTGVPGATVTVRDPGGAAIGSAVVAGDGSYTATLTPPQADGEALTAVQVSAAGNASPATTFTAPDITAPAAPAASVNADGTAVNGTGEPGAIVTVRDPAGTLIGSGQVAADGSFAVPVSPAQANGQQLSVVQTDGSGNPSAAAQATAPDITAPAAPTLTISADGASVSGTGEPGATVTITDPAGTAIGSAVVAPDGGYTTTLTAPRTSGETLTARQEDLGGNESPAATATAPDLVVPAAPTAAVTGDGGAITGTGEPDARVVATRSDGTPIGVAQVAPDGSFTLPLTPPLRNGEVVALTQADAAGNVSPATNATAPDLTAPAAPAGTVAGDGASLTGTGEPGAAISITSPAGAVIGTATVTPDGTFTAPLDPPQLNGEQLGIVQRDAAGNASPSATAIAPDVTAPAIPTAVIAADGSAVTGTGEAGATIRVTGPGGTPLGTATAAADGSYAIPLTPALLNGEQLSVAQIDGAGNTSPAVDVVAPDRTAPAAPTATVAADGTTVSGVGEPGASVAVIGADGTVIGTATVAPGGTYTALLTTPQANGELVSVRQTDAAGNSSPSTPAVAPDITAPTAPTLAISATGALATGTGEPGATVTIRGTGGVVLGTAVVAPNGSYAAALNPPQDDGETVTATQADRAGNVSPPASATAPDETAPLVPTATVSADGSAVTGTGIAGGLITVTGPGGAVIGTATVAPDGSYTAPLTTPQRNGELLGVTQADGAGNVSPSVPALAPDLTAPAAPAATVSPDGATVTGTGEAGATVTITSAAGAVLGTTTVGAGGTYSANLTTPQANGEVLTVRQADAAGNASAPTSATAPDITAPGAPTGLAVTPTGTTLTGTGEAGATVEVRNGAGTVIGTGTVAPNGSFSVGLTPPQATGGTLSVTQRDVAGNLSSAGTVAAPFDIDASDNTDDASVGLVAASTAVNFGTANYLALVSLGLLDLDAQVLSIPAVQFTVQPGHRLDATFTYDAVLNLGVASGYAVVVQRLEEGSWVAVEEPGPMSLLQLGLLNGNITATDTFGPGTYRAFLTFEGTAGVGLLGTLNVAGVDTDFTDIVSVSPTATTGNVITDPGTDGIADVTSPGTVVQSVAANGTTTTLAADGTVVDGAWGTLVINRDGSYTYTPDASAAVIGQTDTFTYTLVDPTDGELESATLSITIGTPDVTGAPVAANDADVAAVTYQNVVTTVAPTPEFSFNTGPGAVILPSTGSGRDGFVVAAGTTSDVTITATRAAGLAVLPSYTLVVTNTAGVEVARLTQSALAALPLGPASTTFRLEDVPAGEYRYTLSSTNVLGLGYATSVTLGESITFANQYNVASRTAAEGNLLDNDTPNTSFATIRVDTGNGFAEVGNSPLVVTGAHGTLTVGEAGTYLYQPSATLPYSATDLTDVFTYEVVQPNGAVATATLTITIDVPADGALPAAAVVGPQTLSFESDLVSLNLELPSAGEPAAMQADPAAVMRAFGMFEGRGELETVLEQYLAARQEAEASDGEVTPVAEPLPLPEATPLPEPADPLGYLAMPDDFRHHEQPVNHLV